MERTEVQLASQKADPSKSFPFLPVCVPHGEVEALRLAGVGDQSSAWTAGLSMSRPASLLQQLEILMVTCEKALTFLF